MPVNSTTEFLSPLTLQWLAGAVGAALLLFLLLRLLAGPPSVLSRRWGLFAIRAVVLLLLGLLLLNPVRINEHPGPIEPSDVFYLLDNSESMNLGTDRTRWETVTDLIHRTDALIAPVSVGSVKTFQFGHRFATIEPSTGGGQEADAPESPAKVPSAANRPERNLPPRPTGADSQLVPALQRLSSRFGRTLPGAVVLFSDGRVRDPAGARKLARYYGQLGVPIHVAPAGETGKGGDVAVAGLVAPRRVRKQSEVEVQVFLRSFGYDGRRSSVELFSDDSAGAPPRKLAQLPVSLESGIQSCALTFRSDLRTRRIRVTVPPQPDEISEENNALTTEIAVDRTKIRVLYVQGNGRQPVPVQGRIRRPYDDLQRALRRDPDIECVILLADGTAPLERITNRYNIGGRSFPKTVAELAAFDATILSNVAQHSFTDEQLAWIEDWVARRGAGLCMVGGPLSFAAGRWHNGPLAQALPVELDARNDWLPGVNLAVDPASFQDRHPIFHIVDDAAANRRVLESFPPVSGGNRFVAAGPNLTSVLASTTSFDSRSLNGGAAGSEEPAAQNPAAGTSRPAIVAGRYGKGRTLAISAPITVPFARKFIDEWGSTGDNRYYVKFWQNTVYWLTENSSVGRRRLIVSADKRFYRPGETITLTARAFDESANRTSNYRVITMIEPQSLLTDLPSDYTPIRWPEQLTRESGEEGPLVAWGEEFDLPRAAGGTPGTGNEGYRLELPIDDVLPAGSSSQALRLELTAYEGFTQIDSTSIDIQILHDPFEHQNPLPDHGFLQRVAEATGGRVLHDAGSLAALINDLPTRRGTSTFDRVLLWNRWWLLGLLLLLLTAEWLWRRSIGLA